MEALIKRRDWVAARAGGGYDERERIALSYAIGLMQAALSLGLVRELEHEAVHQGWIYAGWVEPFTREETEDGNQEEDLPAG